MELSSFLHEDGIYLNVLLLILKGASDYLV